MATVTPKVAIIHYSSTGTIHAMAQDYAKGLENAGAEVRIRNCLLYTSDAADD